MPPKTDRFVSSSLGSFAYVPGKDGWLLLMIFSLTKNIIHRTQISGSAERHWWWIELPHRRKKSRSAWERILSFVNAPIFRQRFSAVLQPWWKALLKQYQYQPIQLVLVNPRAHGIFFTCVSNFQLLSHRLETWHAWPGITNTYICIRTFFVALLIPQYWHRSQIISSQVRISLSRPPSVSRLFLSPPFLRLIVICVHS